MQFTVRYALTRSFPKEELFGLTSQLRRSCVSIASNIAEGQGRLTLGEMLHFLGMARGSAFEAETQMEVAKAEGYGEVAALERAVSLVNEVEAMLNASIHSLRAKVQASKRPHQN